VLVEVRVESLGLDRATSTPVVLLREHDGERMLPIWIGPGEASSIAMQLAGMKFSRPLTHDLFVSMLSGLGGTLKRVLITRVESDTYFAELIIHRGDEMISVDARPSDSIAVALRLKAKIFAQESLLDRTSIEVHAEETSSELELCEPIVGVGDTESRVGAQELKEYLRKLNPEDFGRFSP
jgi:hypothetical protein